MGAKKVERPRPQKLLRRYAELPVAIDLLVNRRIFFLSPSLWDDRNDSHFIRKYKEERKAAAVLAICLSSIGETYHHWRVFCGHSSGVCIEFFSDKLTAFSKTLPGVRSGPVRYMTLDKIEDEIRKKKLPLSQLPFVKRHAFRHEKEFRLIYESADKEDALKTAHRADIPLSLVHGVTLSPWMPLPLFEATKKMLKSIPGCESIEIARSELTENERWKRNADSFRATGAANDMKPTL